MLDHGHGVILGQVNARVKTNEIPMFATLPDHVDLAGAADALHALRTHAGHLAISSFVVVFG